MGIQQCLLLYLIAATYNFRCIEGLNRSSFPAGFRFGVGSSAYQYEGAAYIDGKGPSLWDTFTRIRPEKITDHSNGNLAEDFYHQYKEDVAHIKKLGLDTFRFSISWSRVLPKGRITGGINKQGVEFYNNLIDELLSNGIQPSVTLLHFDPPQDLEDEYGGVLSSKIVNDYRDYVDFCFNEFGNRVKLWVTVNEPNVFSSDGYATGIGPPGRCSSYVDETCKVGNSGTEPYIAVHHLLLCHGTAVKLYREKYQEIQKGKIGITANTQWMVPKYETTACRKAAFRALDFKLGWIVDPITHGDYPLTMRSIVGHRLPKFTQAQSEMLVGSFDFLGVNYYFAYYAEDSAYHSNVNLSYTTDSHVNLTTEKNGIPLGEPTTYSGYYFYPKGIEDLVLYIRKKYNNPSIYITENGVIEKRNPSLTLQEALNDSLRISFFSQHLSYLSTSIKKGADVRAYYAWSFLDDFEWELGYTIQMGLTYVDFKDGFKRYFKNSALWFNKFLQKEDVNTGASLICSQ
ncbi:Glyco_hydro_1 domain-containing protein [Cephalotus follicularis]|uniref:Glyco_hydro_1 domain-containing protein n=1 Tax=Cephalotus follicularis TaxID=3775 RepID=A0A1Q3CDQ4_CEPFO|nr:Glyco_hydro_1 domain-containing protein [Cephalotus follicularis]